MSKLIDLTGKEFNKLKVLQRAPNKGKKTMWHCICSCGNELDVWSYDLPRGHTTSCGHCGRAEKVIDEVGNIYGRLTVLERVENNARGRAMWKC